MSVSVFELVLERGEREKNCVVAVLFNETEPAQGAGTFFWRGRGAALLAVRGEVASGEVEGVPRVAAVAD